MTRLLIISLCSLSLLGCAFGGVLMQDPKSGQIFECTTNSQTGKYVDHRCVTDLEAQGWTNLSGRH